MEYVVLWLLAVVLAELAALMGRELWDRRRQGRKNGGETPQEESDYEKRWQEGVSAMMGYDLKAARRAVRGDDEDER